MTGQEHQSLFKLHLVEDIEYQMGVDKGQWGLHSEGWPTSILWVQANLPKYPDKFYFCFDFEGYSANAPTAKPWDIESGQPLRPEKWPKGPGNLEKVFRPDWEGGKSLYAPCDRLAMRGHEIWKTNHPNEWWQSNFTFVNYLRFIHKLLNPINYEK